MLIKQTAPPNPFSFWRLLLRSFEPSATGLIASSIVSMLLIGGNLLFASMDLGSLAPGVFGEQSGQWTTAYSTYILEPLQTFSNSNTLNTFLVAVVWGFVGWLLYALISFIVSGIREVRGSQEAIYIPNETHVVHHPLRRMLVARLLWRLLVIVSAIAVLIFMLPLFTRMSQWGQDLVLASSTLDAMRISGCLFVSWMLVQYVFVVFLRLFLFRTRVYGEIVD